MRRPWTKEQRGASEVRAAPLEGIRNGPVRPEQTDRRKIAAADWTIRAARYT
jgi:hypothetical protein